MKKILKEIYSLYKRKTQNSKILFQYNNVKIKKKHVRAVYKRVSLYMLNKQKKKTSD